MTTAPVHVADNSLRDGPAAKRSRRGAASIAYLCLGLATLALFWRVVDFPFIDFDDHEYIVDNEFLELGFVPQGIAWAWMTFRGGNWHPLTWLVHMLDYQFFGLDAGAYHLGNVLLHVANSLLVLRVLGALTGSLWRSALVAALFALHPLHVEPVVWVSERKLLLCTFFLLLAVAAYLRYVQRRSTARYLLVVLVTALGLLSKATAVTLPLLLLLLDFWPLGRLRPGLRSVVAFSLVKEKVPLFALAGVKAVLTLYAATTLPTAPSASLIPLGERLGNALISYAQYLKMTVWPAGLAVLYPYPERLHRGHVLLAIAALVLLSVLAVRFAGSRPAVTMGWLWYLLVLFPMIGIVQVGAQVRADRYTYIAHLGVFIAATWGLPRPRQSALTALGVAATLCGCFLVSWQQIAYWRDSRSLFQRAVDVTRDNYYAHNYLARELARERRFDEALAHLQRAREISPFFPSALIDTGITLTRMERWREALPYFREAVRLDPGSAPAHRGLARVLRRLDRLDEAIAHFMVALRLRPEDDYAYFAMADAIESRKGAAAARRFFRTVLELNPESGEARFGLGLSLAEAGRFREAIAHLSRAAELLPDSAATQYNLAKAYRLSGQPERGLEHYRLALAIDPDLPEAHNNLGVILADRGQADEAIGHFRRSLHLNPGYMEAHYNLGLSLLRQGDAAGAEASFRTVLALSPDHAPARRRLWELQGFNDESAPRDGQSPNHEEAGDIFGGP